MIPHKKSLEAQFKEWLSKEGNRKNMKDYFNQKTRDALIMLSMKNNGNWEGIYEDIKNNVDVFNDAVLVEKLERFHDSEVAAVTIIDEDYPEILKQSYKPPFVLFYTGDLAMIDRAVESIGILGKELISDNIVSDGGVVTLLGREEIEIKDADSYVFVTTSLTGDMNVSDSARLFASLSNAVFLDNASERRFNLLVMMYAHKFGMQIVSTPNDWVMDIAEENVEFVESFADLL